jgi:hypothetical protein
VLRLLNYEAKGYLRLIRMKNRPSYPRYVSRERAKNNG